MMQRSMLPALPLYVSQVHDIPTEVAIFFRAHAIIACAQANAALLALVDQPDVLREHSLTLAQVEAAFDALPPDPAQMSELFEAPAMGVPLPNQMPIPGEIIQDGGTRK